MAMLCGTKGSCQISRIGFKSAKKGHGHTRQHEVAVKNLWVKFQSAGSWHGVVVLNF